MAAQQINTQMTTITKSELFNYRRQLEMAAEEAAAAGDPEWNNIPDSEFAKTFSTGEAVGKAVYKSYGDEELLQMLRRYAHQLGHAPAQKEVYWIFRNYLRLRFQKWPYALKKAGLSTQAGRGGMSIQQMAERKQRYDELMALIKNKAKELGRPPHMGELEQIRDELRLWFTTWDQVLKAAGVDLDWQKKEILYKLKQPDEETLQMLNELKALAVRLGRVPLRSEIPADMRKRLGRKCGTWRNTLYQINLEPVTKLSPFSNTYLAENREQQKKHQDILQNSLYKLVEPDLLTIEMLEKLRATANQLGRAPIKLELDPELYAMLKAKCGTFRNVLYQVGLQPLNKGMAAQIEQELRHDK